MLDFCFLHSRLSGCLCICLSVSLLFGWFLNEVFNQTVCLQRINITITHEWCYSQWRKSMQFRQICLFTSDSTQEIYISNDNQWTSLQTYTPIFSLKVKMVEILTDLNWKWKWGSENIRPLQVRIRALPPPRYWSFTINKGERLTSIWIAFLLLFAAIMLEPELHG